MSLSPKLESIFSIVAAFGTMQYKFENEAVSEVSKKLVIAATNPLVCYLIVKIIFVNSLLITKLIVFGNEFKVFGEISFASDGTAKPKEKTKSGQYVPRQHKN